MSALTGVFSALQELSEIRGSSQKIFRNITVDDCNILYWQGLIIPVGILISLKLALFLFIHYVARKGFVSI